MVTLSPKPISRFGCIIRLFARSPRSNVTTDMELIGIDRESKSRSDAVDTDRASVSKGRETAEQTDYQ